MIADSSEWESSRKRVYEYGLAKAASRNRVQERGFKKAEFKRAGYKTRVFGKRVQEREFKETGLRKNDSKTYKQYTRMDPKCELKVTTN